MPVCKTIRRRHRKICIGDLDNLVKLQNRSLTAPSSGVDATEEFTDFQANPNVYALMETVNGKEFFDGIGTVINITHNIYIGFITGVTAETWIEFDGRRFDILDVEDLDERKEFLRLICNDRGDKLKVASGA